MRFSLLFVLSKVGFAADCENGGYQFPKGLYNPDDSGDEVYLSNLYISPDYIYSGGQYDSPLLMAGATSFLGGNGGAFATKSSFYGHTVWFNFYNTAISMQIINIVYLEATGNIFAQLDNGLILLLSDEDGSIIKAKRIEN